MGPLKDAVLSAARRRQAVAGPGRARGAIAGLIVAVLTYKLLRS